MADFDDAYISKLRKFWANNSLSLCGKTGLVCDVKSLGPSGITLTIGALNALSVKQSYKGFEASVPVVTNGVASFEIIRVAGLDWDVLVSDAIDTLTKNSELFFEKN